ncbi:MAG: choice-of-anchor tandem repeat NxxGxxAF-containing protein [Phycisphaerae bacterium]
MTVRAALVTLCAGLLSTAAYATTYTFTKILDNQAGAFTGHNLDAPQINDAGQVLFTETDPNAVVDEDTHFWRKTGGTVVQLFSVGPTGTYSQVFGRYHLGQSGKVLASLPGVSGRDARLFDGVGSTALYSSVSLVNGLNAADTISYSVTPTFFHYRGNGGPATLLFNTGSGFLSPPNSSGQAALAAAITLVPPVNGVRRTDGVGPIITIADSTGPLLNCTTFPDINDAGDVLLLANLDAGGAALWLGNGGPITTLADESGAYGSLLEYDLNNSGKIAFGAILDDFNVGIYTGANAVSDKVIQTGDTLDGQTVMNVAFLRGGFNNNGQIGFQVAFDALQENQALYIATPVVGCTPDGDMNVDTQANGADVQPFTAALLAGSTTSGDLCHGDFSANAVIDAADVTGFVQKLLAP